MTLRLRIRIQGAVQGVGFRPFVYRLATVMKLSGWVNNSSQGVFIEVEGDQPTLENFLGRLEAEKPPRAIIQSLRADYHDPVGFNTFEIRHSEDSGNKSVLVLPDIATCTDCLSEVVDPHNRRYRYPFTNCTNCGPRYTIIEALPYDRPTTTMKHFPMCPDCQAEYDNPLDRRFHAQPNACPTCGPHLELWDKEGITLATHHDALLAGADAVRQGKIVAVKGLGGFHLIVDGRNEVAVQQLRQRKHRPAKPFALMFPSLSMIQAHCKVSALEEELLTSAEAPIVLLRSKSTTTLAPGVAPGNPTLGVMLPYTPLHYLLLHELEFPVVATSGNLSDEPICTDEYEALDRLGDIADVFLVHNRPIVRHVDDSIVREIAGREIILRRARGYAPLPIHVETALPRVLAVGAHLKNSIAAAIDQDIFISQHIGDLETPQAFDAFQAVIESFKRLYEFEPEIVACDLHPDYLSTQYARTTELPLLQVQHHYAHVLACMAEHNLNGPVLGISWDGTGYGPDGTIWGGEFLLVNELSYERVAHLRPFRLPGGDKAIKEPARTAIGVLYEIYGDDVLDKMGLPPVAVFSEKERAILQQMLSKGLNSPLTSSTGRLFDAVAALVGLRQRVSYEGQAAIELEYMLDGVISHDRYDFTLRGDVVDWEPMVMSIINARQEPLAKVAAKFHNTLVEMMIMVAKRTKQKRIVLTGGCFQNQYLTERAVQRLQFEGFEPYWHQRVPPNDGGIALGQIIAATRKR